MSKKATCSLLSLLMVFALVFASPVNATATDKLPESKLVESGSLRWSNVTLCRSTLLFSSKVDCSITVSGLQGTTYSNGTILLEKEINGAYSAVKSWSNISCSQKTYIFRDSSVTATNGTYRLTIEITATRNGQAEVITDSIIRTKS